MRISMISAMVLASTALCVPTWAQEDDKITFTPSTMTSPTDVTTADVMYHWTSADITQNGAYVTKTIELAAGQRRSGVITVTFDYTGGWYGLNTRNVKAYGTSDTTALPIAVDEHYGTIGSGENFPVYRLYLDDNIATTLTCEIMAVVADTAGNIIVRTVSPTVDGKVTLGSGSQTWLNNVSPSWVNDIAKNLYLDVPSAGTQFAFDTTAEADQVVFMGDGALTLSATTVPAITTLDLGGMQGDSTINFNTGAIDVVAGASTTLKEEGTGTLIVSGGRTATLHNILWDESKIQRAYAGRVAYSADTGVDALTALPLKGSANTNVVISRPLVIADRLDFIKPCTYTFKNTTIDTVHLTTNNAGGANTTLILDETTLTVTGTNNGRDTAASLLIGHWGGTTATMTMINASTLSAPNTVAWISWDSVTDFSVTQGSTLDVKGLITGHKHLHYPINPISFTLDNSTLKLGATGFDFDAPYSTATFKDGAQIHAQVSAPLAATSPIRVEGAVTLAVATDQTLTVSATFDNVNDDTPAAFTLGTPEYAGTIKLGATSRPCIASVKAPLIVVPSMDEILAGRVVFPTTLATLPTTAITFEGYTAPSVVSFKGVKGAKLLVLSLPPSKVVELDGTGTPTWSTAINGDGTLTDQSSVVITLAADTTLTLDADVAIRSFTVKHAVGTPVGVSHTLTLAGDFTLTSQYLKICDGAKLATSAASTVTTIARGAENRIIFDNGTLVLGRADTFVNPITVEMGGGTIDVNGTTGSVFNGVVTGDGILTRTGLGDILMPDASHTLLTTQGMTFNAGTTGFGSFDGIAGCNGGIVKRGSFVVNNQGTILHLGCNDLNLKETTIQINEGAKLTNNGYNYFGNIELTGGELATMGGASGTWQSVALFGSSIMVKGAMDSKISALPEKNSYVQAAIVNNVEINVADLAGRLVVTQDIIQHAYHGGTYTLTKTGSGTWESNARVAIPGIVYVNAGMLTGTGAFTGVGGVVFADGAGFGGSLVIDKASFAANVTLNTSKATPAALPPTIKALTLPPGGTSIILKGAPSTTEKLLTWETKPENAETLITCMNAPTGYKLAVSADMLGLELVSIPAGEMTVVALDGTERNWSSLGVTNNVVTFTLTADTTLSLDAVTTIGEMTVENAIGSSYTLTLTGNALTWDLLKISNGAKVAIAADATMGMAAENKIFFDDGTLIMAQNLTLNNAFIIGAGGGTIVTNGVADANGVTCSLYGTVTGTGILTRMGEGILHVSRNTVKVEMALNAGKTFFGNLAGGPAGWSEMHVHDFVVNNANTVLEFNMNDSDFGKITLKINEGAKLTNSGYNLFGHVELTGGELATVGGANTGHQSVAFRGSPLLMVKGALTSRLSASADKNDLIQAILLNNMEINVVDPVGRLVVTQDIIGGEHTLTKTGPGTWEQHAAVHIPGAVYINAGTLTGAAPGRFDGTGRVFFGCGTTLNGSLAINNATFASRATLSGSPTITHATFAEALTLNTSALEAAPTIGTLTLPFAGTVITLTGDTSDVTGDLLTWNTKPVDADFITCVNTPPAGYKLVADSTGLAFAKVIELGGAATWDGSSITSGDVSTPITATDIVVITLTAPTTLTLLGEIPLVRKLIVKSPGAISHTLTLEGGALSWSKLEIGDGAIVALSATTTIALARENAIIFDNGTLVMGQSLTLNNAITVSAGGGTLDTNGHACGTTGQITGDGVLTRVGTGDFVMTDAVGITNNNAQDKPLADNMIEMTFGEGRTVFGHPILSPFVDGGVNYRHRWMSGAFVVDNDAELYLGCVDIIFAKTTVKVNQGATLTNASYNRFGRIELTGGELISIGGANGEYPSAAFFDSIIAKGVTPSKVSAVHDPKYNNSVQGAITADIEINVEEPTGRLIVAQELVKHVHIGILNPGVACGLTKVGSGTWEQNASVSIPETVKINAGMLTGTGAFTGVGGVVFADGVGLGGSLVIDKASFDATVTLDTDHGIPTIKALTIPATGTSIILKGTPSTTEKLLTWDAMPENAETLITCTNLPQGYTLVVDAAGLALGTMHIIDVGGASQDVKEYIEGMATKDVSVTQEQAEHIYLFGLTKIPESDVSFQLTEMVLSADATTVERMTFTVTTDSGALPAGGEIKGAIRLNGGTTLDAITAQLTPTDTPPTAFTISADKNIGTLTITNVSLTQVDGDPFTFIKGVVSTK